MSTLLHDRLTLRDHEVQPAKLHDVAVRVPERRVPSLGLACKPRCGKDECTAFRRLGHYEVVGEEEPCQSTALSYHRCSCIAASRTLPGCHSPPKTGGQGSTIIGSFGSVSSYLTFMLTCAHNPVMTSPGTQRTEPRLPDLAQRAFVRSRL